MELKGKKAPKKKSSPAPKGTKKKEKVKVKTRSRAHEVVQDEVDVQDEIITEETELREDTAPEEPKVKEITPVLAFEQGIVSPAMKTAMNAHWGRTEETVVLMMAMRDAFMVNGVFIGDIVIKPSFVKRAKGSALL